MAKQKSVFYCQNCGTQSSNWIGKCPNCSQWNTFVEEVIQRDESSQSWDKLSARTKKSKPQKISDVEIGKELRIDTNSQEINRVLGGGMVPGSLILIGGEPGIGKSTLMLQLALNIKNQKVLFVTGEESEQQIKMRAERVGGKNPELFILAETSTKNILSHIEQLDPEVLIIDSIQTLHTSVIESSAGSISQIKECAAEMQRY